MKPTSIANTTERIRGSSRLQNAARGTMLVVFASPLHPTKSARVHLQQSPRNAAFQSLTEGVRLFGPQPVQAHGLHLRAVMENDLAES